jgi:hypothetical protein
MGTLNMRYENSSRKREGDKQMFRNSSASMLGLSIGEDHPVKKSIFDKKMRNSVDLHDPKSLQDDSLPQINKTNRGLPTTVGYYNPITNPVNGFSHNPYLTREKQKAVAASYQSQPV